MTQTGDVFRALADPTRRAMLEQLAQGEETVSRLTSRFGMSQPAISQHLAVLRQAGLVADRHSGRNVYYRARPEGLTPLIDWIDRYESFWRARLRSLKRLLEEGIEDGSD